MNPTASFGSVPEFRALDLHRATLEGCLFRHCVSNKMDGPPSLRFDAGGADHPTPFLRVFDDEFAEFGAGHRSRHAAKLAKSRLYLRVGKTSVDRVIEPVEDFGWSALWRANANECGRFVAWHKLANGRNPGQRG